MRGRGRGEGGLVRLKFNYGCCFCPSTLEAHFSLNRGKVTLLTMF